MSLTSQLSRSQSPLRKWLEQHFPATGVSTPVNRVLRGGPASLRCEVVPVTGSDAALVGTAVGYVLSAVLREDALDRTHALKGATVLGPIMPRGVPRDLPAQAERAAVARVRELAPASRPLGDADWVELLGLAIFMARLDQAGRAPLGLGPLVRLVDRFKLVAAKGLTELVPAFATTAETFADLDNLAHATVEDWRHLADFEDLIIGPTFAGVVSPGRAEADLFADGTLIELKSTQQPNIAARKTLWQILGYVLSDTTDAYGIRSCRLVALRWRSSYQWSVQEFLDTLAGGPTNSVDHWRREFASLLPRTESQEPRPALSREDKIRAITGPAAPK